MGLREQTRQDWNWRLEELSYHLEPEKVEELERLRSRGILGIFPIPGDLFAQIILNSAWALRKTQENIYTRAKIEMPDASEKERLEAVFRSRIFPQNPAGLEITEKEANKAIRNINSLNDLIEYFSQKEKPEIENGFIRDIFGLGKKIIPKVDEILEE